jgi:MoxR-like ATPase
MVTMKDLPKAQAEAKARKQNKTTGSTRRSRRTKKAATGKSASRQNRATPRKANRKRTPAPRLPWGESGWLDRIGLVGLKSVEPVILAAVIAGDPLLLIGPHGTAKSYLLARICAALGLDWRHYNASLLNYDDLVGYPLPDADGKLKFVETPASIWGAEAVFFDEISRCRIDLQNKLFPIIHERRVQGIELKDLVHRWAAMNPPADPDSDELDESAGQPGYEGSEPLDPALADRFAFIVPVPDWSSFSERHRRRLLLESQRPIPVDVAARLCSLVEAGRTVLPGIAAECSEHLAAYVDTVCQLLANSHSTGLQLSGRRGAMLLRNILAVHAARIVLEKSPKLEDSASLALRHSIPDRARGKEIPRLKLLAAHREAWAIAPLDKQDPRRFLLLERNPALKVRAATQIPSLTRTAFSTIVADAVSSLPVGASHAVAAWLFESDQAGRLVAAIGEQVGTLYAVVANQSEVHCHVSAQGTRHNFWREIQRLVAERNGNPRRRAYLKNLLLWLFNDLEFCNRISPEPVAEDWATTWDLLTGARK